MKTNIASIIDTLPKEKQKSDSLWIQLVARPISFPVTWIFLKIGFRAFWVSVIAIIVQPITLILWFNGYAVMASILLNIWIILDAVDGNIARVRGSVSQFGDFVDSTSGYLAIAFCWFGIGSYVDLYNQGIFGLETPWFTSFGALASLLNLTSRIYYQKFQNVRPREFEQKDETFRSQLVKRIDKNIGISGFFLPILLLFSIYDFLAYLVIFYVLYYSVVFLYTAFTLLRKAKS